VGSLGDVREARRWWRTARRVADASGDPSAGVWIRGREVVRALYERRPAPAILRLVEEAEAMSSKAPVAALPSLVAGKAQVLAMTGRAREAEAALRQLQGIYADLPADVTGDDDSWFGWTEARLRFAESFVHSHLGRFDRATTAQDRALALYPASYPRGPAQIELQRALCLVRSGDARAGARHAQATMASLPREQHNLPIIDLGRTVLRAVPAAAHRQPAVAEFHEYLSLTSSPSARKQIDPPDSSEHDDPAED
jgi:tetratricopeptide (TPR) repeat protein